MDYLTKLYKNNAEILAERVAYLEAQLKYLNEDNGQYQGNSPNQRTTSPKYGRGTRSGVVGGGGTAQGSEEIDFTGGNVDPKTGAWSPSSGGPAIADTEAGDAEIQSRMRQIARGGGLFGKGIENTEQTPAYKEMAGELERRKAARDAKASGSKAGAEGSVGAGTGKSAVGAGDVGKVGGTDTTAISGKDRVPAPTPKVGVGGVPDRLPPSKPEERTVSPKPTGTEGGSDKGSGIDPKLVVLGLAGAGYAGAKAKEYYDRQREKGKGTEKPKTPEAKAEEIKAPEAKTPEAKARAGEVKGQPPELLAKPEESGKVGGGRETVKAPESTIGGEPVQKGKPSVAERAAMGRDRLRAKMDANRAAEAEAKPETKMTGGEVGGRVEKVTTGTEVPKSGFKIGSWSDLGKTAKALAIDLPAMHVAGEAGEEVAKAAGAGPLTSGLAGIATSFAGPAIAGALGLGGLAGAATIATGYGAGKALKYGIEKSGFGDVMQKTSDIIGTEMSGVGKGVESKEEATKEAQKIAAEAKKARRTDLGKGFAPGESQEFAKRMQDPEFRKKHEEESEAAYRAEVDRQTEGDGWLGRLGAAAMPDWVAKAGEEIGSWKDSLMGEKPTKKGSARGMSYEKD